MSANVHGALLKSIASAQSSTRLINQHEGRSRLLGLALVRCLNTECIADGLLSESFRVELEVLRVRLSECLRSRDELVPVAHGLFAILFKSVESLAHFELATTRLERALSRPLYCVNDRLNARIHGALVPVGAEQDTRQALRSALVGLKRAQDAGLRLFSGADSDSTVPAQEEALLEALESALYEGELVPYFQPQVHCGYHSVVGAEALVRWQSPQRGLVLPANFMPQLERSKLAAPFTHRMVRSVLGCMGRWPDSLHVAINVPAGLLASGELQFAIKDALELFAIDPGRVTIEITEASFVGDTQVCQQALESLQAMGLRISIDDFGTGYSSLSYLRDLPANELKLDRSFIRNLCTSAKDRTLVRSVVDLAHEFGLSVVGEGVEDLATADVLKTLGCDVLQGYYFAKPMPATELRAWLNTNG